MKKFVTMMTAVLMVIFAAGLSVHAAEEKTVWIDPEKAVLVDGKLQVAVSTDGTVTDGLLTLAYDSDVLTLTEESDVKVAESVDMHALNLVDDEMRFSFVAEDPIEKGDLLMLTFSTKCTSAEEALKGLEKLTGEGYTKDGSFKDDAVGILTDDAETPGTDSKDDQNQTGKTDTGDHTNMIVPVICLVAAMAGMITIFCMKRRGGNHNEM